VSRAWIIAMLSMGMAGCFIDELPSYKDDGSGVSGRTPPIRSLAVGSSTSCAVLTTGEVRCWGSVLPGLGSYGAMRLRPAPVMGLAGIEAMALAPYHGCVLIAGKISCFGANDQGQLGNGQQINGMDFPLQPTIGGDSVVQLSLESSVSGARTADGTVLTWGAGFIGFGGWMPTPVMGVASARDLSLGGDHTCAVHDDGTVSCWGWSTSGQLGRGTVPPPNQQTVETPGPVLGVSDATQVIAGFNNCVLHADGTVSCWGAGNYFNPPQPTPTLIPGLTGVQALATGDPACALLTAGTVVCWGDSPLGAPVPVPGLTDIVELASGGSSRCARRGDGEVLCWGSNIPGDGSTMASPTPVQVRW
jgi:alpha-tubulin suppressor-like RCC1 family protein